MPGVHHGVAASPLAFFSFPEVTDPRRHRDYNAWHQLDHLPENRALPGVLHGERWVRTPSCRAMPSDGADPDLDAAHYVAMYWFRDPADEAVAAWRALGETTREQGRRPELAWTVRRYTGFFRPVGGAAAPRALVTAEAVPYRPGRGVVIEVQRVDGPVTAAPLPVVDGVAGTWTFAGADEPLRIALHYCDGDPVAVAERLVGAAEPDPPGTRTLLRSPLLTVTPGEWDWFEEDDDGPA